MGLYSWEGGISEGQDVRSLGLWLLKCGMELYYIAGLGWSYIAEWGGASWVRMELAGLGRGEVRGERDRRRNKDIFTTLQ